MSLWRFPSLRFQLLGVALNRSTTSTVLHFVGNVLLHAYMVHNDGCLASLKVKKFHIFFSKYLDSGRVMGVMIVNLQSKESHTV